jgi:hypothetical protein
VSRPPGVADRAGPSDASVPYIQDCRGPKIGPPKENMHTQNMKSADHPRRRLSLRFSDVQARPQRQAPATLPTKELQRIVAEMVG